MCGQVLERAAKRGMETHASGGPLACDPPVKRPCVRYWWSHFGASVKGGSIVIPSAQFNLPASLTLHGDTFFITEHRHCRLLRWHISAAAGVVIAGHGAAVT